MEIKSSWFFNHIKGERPYSTPKSTREWMTITPSKVDISNLVTTQPKLSVRDIIRSFLGYRSVGCVDQVPHIVYYYGMYWVSDGHHRIAAGRLKGKKVMYVRLWTDSSACRASFNNQEEQWVSMTVVRLSIIKM